MKEFNLEAALRGEPVITHDGRKVEQLFYFDKATENPHKLCAVIDGIMYGYDDGGEFFDKKTSKHDLFMAAVTKKV